MLRNKDFVVPTLFVIIFFVVFDPYFNLGNGIGSVIGSVAALICVVGRYFYLKNSEILTVACFACFLLIVTILAIIANGQVSFSLTLIKVGIVGCSFQIFFRLFPRENLEKFWTSFSLVWIFQSMYVILCFFMPEIRDVANIMRPPANSHIYDAIALEGNLIRLWPASGQLASGLAAICVSSFLALFVSSLHNATKIKNLGLIAVFVVGLTAGRTFYIVFPMAIFVGLYLSPKKIIAFACLALGLSFFIYQFLQNINESLADWMFEPVLNIIAGEGLSTKSTNSLMQNHLFFPSMEQILVPSFNYKSNGLWAAGSDSGLIRYLIFGGPLFVLVFFLLFYFFIRNMKSIAGFMFAAILLSAISIKQESLTNASFVFSLMLLVWSVKSHEFKQS